MTTQIQVEGGLYCISNTDFDTTYAFWTRFTGKYQHSSQSQQNDKICRQFNKKDFNLQKERKYCSKP
jgi:hypothetical protein